MFPFGTSANEFTCSVRQPEKLLAGADVREMQNRVKRAVIMADKKRITAEDLELGDGSGGATPTNLKEAREAVERELVLRALRNHSDKITAAAAELGISRPTFYELMEKLDIHRTEPEPKSGDNDSNSRGSDVSKA